MRLWTLSLTLFFGVATAILGQPVITKQPGNQTASPFADVIFRVTVSGEAPLSYQWRFNDADLLGKTNGILTITNVQRADAGNYNVVVSNATGSITSRVATLTITPFNSCYFFGFSWTDTHNCAQVYTPPNYYRSHPSNGPMWPEFLCTNLGLAYIEGNNYAVCGGNSSWVRDQAIRFQAPPNPKLSAYFAWLSTDDLTARTVTNQAAYEVSVQTQMKNYFDTFDQLYRKGAREIIVDTLFDPSKLVGKFPEVTNFGSDTAGLAKYSAHIARLDNAMIDAMNSYSQKKPDVRLSLVDAFSLVNGVIVDPGEFGFTKSNIDALHDLSDKSFSGPGADYVFWDPLHPTSKFHELIAAWHLEALTNSVLEELQARMVNGSPSIQMNHLRIGREYTLQKSVDLASWQEATSFTPSAGTNLWQIPSGKDSTAYFRLKWQR